MNATVPERHENPAAHAGITPAAKDEAAFYPSCGKERISGVDLLYGPAPAPIGPETIVTPSAPHGSQLQEPAPRKRTCGRASLFLGVPWVLVLVQALALIVSSIVGLAFALFW